MNPHRHRDVASSRPPFVIATALRFVDAGSDLSDQSDLENGEMGSGGPERRAFAMTESVKWAVLERVHQQEAAYQIRRPVPAGPKGRQGKQSPGAREIASGVDGRTRLRDDG